ncbi:MAG: leucine-rich repeat domain-containing protein [Clostridia bacterium]|nr:leucine-rich repeat domain-containing protein [Clostridia bacterium]
MKTAKIIALILALITCLSLVSCKRREGEESRGLEMALSESGEYYTVTGIGKCKDYDVLIPREYKGLPVSAIGERAFSGTKVTRVTLTENVFFIAENAFEDCANITYNELGGIYYIGTEKNPAYAVIKVNENSKDTFLLHKDTKILADCALYDCDINSLSLPSGITHIGKNALYSCGSLESIALPEGLRYIGSEAFGNCLMLSEITLPASLEHMGSSAFMYCTKLKKITFAGTEAEWQSVRSEGWSRYFDGAEISFAK